MIRACLVVGSFVISLYSCTTLFGVANGFVAACFLTACVAFASDGLWPERRRDPVKIEPRLSRPAQPRFGTPTRPTLPLLLAPPMEGGATPEESLWDSVIRFTGPFDPAVWDDVRRDFDGKLIKNPTIEIQRDGATEILRDLARRVTPEMLALPIPTAVRTLLDDLRAAGE